MIKLLAATEHKLPCHREIIQTQRQVQKVDVKQIQYALKSAKLCSFAPSRSPSLDSFPICTVYINIPRFQVLMDMPKDILYFIPSQSYKLMMTIQPENHSSTGTNDCRFAVVHPDVTVKMFCLFRYRLYAFCIFKPRLKNALH